MPVIGARYTGPPPLASAQPDGDGFLAALAQAEARGAEPVAEMPVGFALAASASGRAADVTALRGLSLVPPDLPWDAPLPREA